MSNRITLITGGSRGIGRDTALAMAKSGFDVIITYLENKTAADKVLDEIENLGVRGAAVQLNVADSSTFNAFADTLKTQLTVWEKSGIDVLVNNAGIGLASPIAETSEADFDTLVNIHLKGPYFLTQTLMPLLQDGGCVINTSTGLARFSLPGYAAYAMMKGGIEVFTRYLAKELAPRKIRVNTIAPGAIATDFRGGAIRDNKDVNQQVASITALGRVGLPEDIGVVIASIASDDLYWVTGQRIEASGGMFL